MQEYYSIKKPSGRRKSFAIEAKLKQDGRELSRKVAIPEVDNVNRLHLAGELTYDQALKHLEAVRERLYRERDADAGKVSPAFHSDNEKFLKRYWKAQYEDRDLVNPESMHYDLKRSLGYLLDLSILAASKEEMQERINEQLLDNPNLQRRIVTRLNQLLTHAGRGFQLRKVRESKDEVAHVTLHQFRTLMTNVFKKDVQALYWTALGTGARLGECFALTPAAIKDDKLQITKQMDDTLRLRETKTRRGRKTWILPEAAEWVAHWAAVPLEKKKEMRNLAYSKKLQKLSKGVIVFHDLRHSYAIHLLQKGVPISQVAQCLGNSVLVCERYYTGFVITDEGIDTIRRIMTPPKPAG